MATARIQAGRLQAARHGRGSVAAAAEAAAALKYVVTTSKNGIVREKMIEDWHISCNGKGAAGSAATT